MTKPNESEETRERPISQTATVTWAAGSVFVAWLVAVVGVALVRVRPWNEWSAWRSWLGETRREWEIFAPGVLLALAVYGVDQAQRLWKADGGWSPRVVGVMLAVAAAGAGGILWGLYTLGLRPFYG
jgi:hypothetical protein